MIFDPGPRTFRRLFVGLLLFSVVTLAPADIGHAAAPGAPTITSVVEGNGFLEVAFTPSGGSAATSYQYSVDGGASWQNTAYVNTTSPLFIGGLTNGIPYSVTIRGVNSDGAGAASNASPGTPNPASTLSGSHAFLQGRYVEVGVRPNGAFGSNVAPPAGFHPTVSGCLGFRVDRQQNGWGDVAGSSSPFANIDDGDYFCPGSPYEGWALRVGSNVAHNSDQGTGIAGSLSSLSTPGFQMVRWRATAAYNDISVSAVYSVPDEGQSLLTTVTLTNVSGAPVSDIYYGRGFDPDNTTGSSSGTQTSSSSNTIPLPGGTSAGAAVKAVFDSGAEVWIASPTTSARARIHGSDCCQAALADPQAVWNGVGQWNATSTSGDNQMNVSVYVPTLGSGQAVTFDINYILTGAAAAAAGVGAAPGLTPVLGDPVEKLGSYTVQILNYDPAFTWVATASSGVATISSSGLIEVAGLESGVVSRISVSTSRPGYAAGVAQTAGRSLPACCTSEAIPSRPVPVTSSPATSPPPTSVSLPSSAVRPTVPGGSIPAVPITSEPGVLPSVLPGTSVVTQDGKAVPVTIVETKSGQWKLTGDNFQMVLEVPAAGANSGARTGGEVTLVQGRTVEVSGSGFQPGSLVDVWLFSTPRFVGTVRVKADGSFDGALDLPAEVPVGPHTLQANGLTIDSQVRSLNLGVRVVPTNPRLPITGDRPAPLLSLATLSIVLGVLGLSLTRLRRQAPRV